MKRQDIKMSTPEEFHDMFGEPLYTDDYVVVSLGLRYLQIAQIVDWPPAKVKIRYIVENHPGLDTSQGRTCLLDLESNRFIKTTGQAVMMRMLKNKG